MIFCSKASLSWRVQRGRSRREGSAAISMALESAYRRQRWANDLLINTFQPHWLSVSRLHSCSLSPPLVPASLCLCLCILQPRLPTYFTYACIILMTGQRTLLVTHASDIKCDNEEHNEAAPTPSAVALHQAAPAWICEGQRDAAVLGTGTSSLGTCVNCKAIFAAKWDELGNGNRQPTMATWNWVKVTTNCKLRLHNSALATCRLCHWSKAPRLLRCVMDRCAGWERRGRTEAKATG